MTKFRFFGLSMLLMLGIGSKSLADSAKFDKQMQPILTEYLKIPEALAADRVKGVVHAARKIGKLSLGLDPTGATGRQAKYLKDLPNKLKAAAGRLAVANDMASMREALKELSKPMALWATVARPEGISVIYCSMAPGSWLQRGTLIANPYFGAQMLRCGEIVAGGGHKK